MPSPRLIIRSVDWSEAAARCLTIRRRVFIEEQQIPETIEIDGRDPNCLHILASRGPVDVGTARLLPDAHVGRVAVLPDYRGQGIGAAIMRAVAEAARTRGDSALHLASQASAVPFYLALGFEPEGPRFMEAGIPHQNMSLKL